MELQTYLQVQYPVGPFPLRRVKFRLLMASFADPLRPVTYFASAAARVAGQSVTSLLAASSTDTICVDRNVASLQLRAIRHQSFAILFALIAMSQRPLQ